MKTAFFTLILAVAVLSASLNAQTLTVYSSFEPGSTICHISLQGTYSPGAGVNFTLGFYDDGTLHDDTARVASLGGVLYSVSCTNAQISEAYGGLANFASSQTYNALTENCGTAVDYALLSASIAAWSQSFESFAISATANRIIKKYFPAGPFFAGIDPYNNQNFQTEAYEEPNILISINYNGDVPTGNVLIEPYIVLSYDTPPS